MTIDATRHEIIKCIRFVIEAHNKCYVQMTGQKTDRRDTFDDETESKEKRKEFYQVISWICVNQIYV